MSDAREALARLVRTLDAKSAEGQERLGRYWDQGLADGDVQEDVYRRTDAILAEFDVTLRENEMEWEYGVKWGDEPDDSQPAICESRAHAESRAAESHGDKIVRRTPARTIPAGEWEEVSDE